MSSYADQVLTELNTEGYDSLLTMFDQICAERSNERAFICLSESLTFAQLEQQAADFGAYLINDCGLRAGDRVAIQLPNIIQYPVAVWGALKAELIVVNTNPQYTAREQTHQFNDSGALALVVLEALLPLTNSVIGDTPIKSVIVAPMAETEVSAELPEGYVSFAQALERGAGSSLPATNATMSDIAVLQYTGGTTGPSKGAMLSHGNLFAGMVTARDSIKLIEPGDPEMPIVPLPLYHVFGFTGSIIGTLLHGGTSILIPDPRNLDSIIHAMKTYPFTYMSSVNTLLQGLMAHPEFDDVDFSNLTAVIAGGTTLVKEIAEEWKQRTGTDIYEGYGLSETSSTATCNRSDNYALGSVGPALEHVQIKLIDSEGASVADGDAGEICIRGANVMQGYWNKPDATAESIDAGGWFKTGDIGIRDDRGRIKIVDRIKDMILVSGFNVYPNEIEAVVYGHPDIVECAAIGVPNEATGEAIKLFVVSRSQQLSADDIIEFCRGELTAYKIPRQIEFAEDLPKSPAGKILRRELRDI